MLSRSLGLVRNLKKLNIKPNNLQVVRNSHDYVYRSGPKSLDKNVVMLAEFAGGVMWWWILWHLFTEFEHITGEFPYPNPAKWTDEELGIPATLEEE